MNKTAYPWAAGLALFAAQVAADVNVVVPGKAAGYLYLQGGGGREDGISLKVNKLPADGKPMFQSYRIESVPPGLICDENCVEAVHAFPPGQVELKIIGTKPVPGITIPLTGMWSGGCHETTSEVDFCVINLPAQNGQVSVKVDPDLEVGTIIDIPGGKAMYVDIDTAQGYMLVAAHDKLGTSRTLMEHDPNRTTQTDITDDNDGRPNTAKLIAHGSNAAQYCQSLGNDWYLPARYEVAKITAAALSKVHGISASVWSSTQYDFSYETETKSNGTFVQKWKYKSYYLSRASNGSSVTMKDMTVYEAKAENGVLKDNKTPASRQVLCFRRIVI